MEEIIIEDFRQLDDAIKEKKVIVLDEDMIMVTAGCCFLYSIEKSKNILRDNGYINKDGKYYPI